MAIKKFIDEYYDNSEKPFTKVKHLLGVVESGVTDLGQRHRNHLIENNKQRQMKAILDTGPWVALIDRSESKHDMCVQWFKVM